MSAAIAVSVCIVSHLLACVVVSDTAVVAVTQSYSIDNDVIDVDGHSRSHTADSDRKNRGLQRRKAGQSREATKGNSRCNTDSRKYMEAEEVSE